MWVGRRKNRSRNGCATRQSTLIAGVARTAFVLAIAVWFSPIAFAQLPAARLSTIFPPGGKCGCTVEVTADGADLDDATEIRFSHAGLSAKPADDSDGQTSRKYSVTIAADVPPGNYEARLVGRFGITNARVFVVGQLPETNAPSAKWSHRFSLCLCRREKSVK